MSSSIASIYGLKYEKKTNYENGTYGCTEIHEKKYATLLLYLYCRIDSPSSLSATKLIHNISIFFALLKCFVQGDSQTERF